VSAPRRIWTTPVRSTLIGFGFFVLGSLSDFWVQAHVTDLAIALLDDALVGIGAGLLVYLYERRQVRNIAERKEAQSAARESEERFRLVANTAPVLIWMSGADKLCTYFNEPWLEFTGRSFEKELGNGWSEGIYPDDLERCLETYSKSFDLRKRFEMEYRLRRHDGEFRWVLDQGVPRFNEHGSFVGYIGSCIDVTERKSAEEVLSNLGQRLMEAHEEERSWIARELHDDICQQLALLALKLNDLKNIPPAATVELGRQVEEARKHVRGLASQVQAISHHLHSSSLDILGLAVAAQEFSKELSARQGVQIDFHSENIPMGLPKEVALCLFRVLQESLQNAIKHSGTRVFQVSLDGKGNEIRLAVHDSGIGFNTEQAMKGLGLTSMKERLKLVRGELAIDSRSEHGTTVTARVPLALSGNDGNLGDF
jgi:PAS domain S-box-containing protein